MVISTKYENREVKIGEKKTLIDLIRLGEIEFDIRNGLVVCL